MERGMAVLSNRNMTTLNYRGKNYLQTKEAPKKELIQLTYRKTVYTKRMEEASSNNQKEDLTYRGVSYNK